MSQWPTAPLHPRWPWRGSRCQRCWWCWRPWSPPAGGRSTCGCLPPPPSPTPSASHSPSLGLCSPAGYGLLRPSVPPQGSHHQSRGFGLWRDGGREGWVEGLKTNKGGTICVKESGKLEDDYSLFIWWFSAQRVRCFGQVSAAVNPVKWCGPHHHFSQNHLVEVLLPG